MADLDRVKRNVSRLVGLNAPESDIDAYIASEGVTLDQVRAHKPGTAAPEKKERSWSDVPLEAVGNIPSSAAKFATDIVQPFLDPVGTAKALGNVGYGLASKAAGAVGVKQDPAKKAEDEAGADAVGQFFKDRYGSWDAAKKTIATDPVGFLGDVTVPLTAGGGIAARGPGIVGKVGSAVQKTGQAIDPLNAAGTAAKATGKVASNVVGALTGTGALPLEEAARAGYSGNKAFAPHMRGTADITEVVDMADRGARALVKDRGDAYKASMEAIKADTRPLNMRPVVQAINEARRSVQFRGVAKSAEAAKVVDDISSKFEEFAQLGKEGRTIEGFDALKQAIGDIQQGTQQGTTARRVADHVYNAVKGEITRQAPEYANTMKGYADASDKLGELKKTLGAGNEKMTTDTALRKLQSTMRNNVNTNYGARTKLLDELAKKEPDLKPALAGQALNAGMPRGLARLGVQGSGIAAATFMNPFAAATIPFSSPWLMGEAAYGLGKGAKVVKDAADLVGRDKLIAALLAAYQTGNVLRPLGDDQ